MSATKEGLVLLAQQGLILRTTNECSEPSLNFHLTKIPFCIRSAEPSDLDQLLKIEEECWKNLNSSKEELIRRLKNSSDQWVAVVDGTVVGVMYTQIVKSIELLKQGDFETQSTMHDESGNILQLLGVAVLSGYASLNISLILRDFVLLIAKANCNIHSVIAMTRCSSNFSSEDEFFTKFREDPTVLFHLSGGAEVLEIVKNYRSRDVSNFGHSILIKYSIRDPKPEESQVPVEPSLTKGELVNFVNAVLNSSFQADSHFLETPFMNLGLDSLNMIELRNQILKFLALDDFRFPPTVMFDHPTPQRLLQFINGVSSISEKLKKSETQGENIIVCGLSCRLPDGANDPQLFYDLLLDGKRTFSEVPREWTNHCQTKYSSFLDESIASTFDPNFFGISVNEANLMDPHQRIILEVVHEALADAGLLPLQTTRIGVFVGACNNEWIAHVATATNDVSPFLGCCVAQSSIANRVSFYLGLHGPSMVVDTACSSSLSALHVALNSLENGDCDYAVVAAADLLISSFSLQLRDASGMLSKTNHNNSFGEGADGYIRGEGAVALVIGRESRTHSAGSHPIYAKILGSVVNHDGKSASFTAPNGTAQRNLLQDVLEKCSVSPSEVDYIECHGTGTRLGDPIEWTAIREVFLQEPSEMPLYLGALKANIGHLEGAAGLAGVLKAILSVFHGTVPKTPVNEINHFINLESSTRKAEILTQKESLRPDAVVGVSSFGSGGSNGHVLIQAYRKNHHRKLSRIPRVAFIFSGQGGLTKENATLFYQNDEGFREIISMVDKTFDLNPSIQSLLSSSTAEDWLSSPTYSNLILFSLELSLAKHWAENGVTPSAVLGHSFGEIAAAVVSQALSFEEAVQLVYHRAQALTKFKIEGGIMVAVRTSYKEAVTALDQLGYLNSKSVSIAGINGPKSVVLSGYQDAVNQVVQHLKASHKQVRTNLAYHSPLLSDAASSLQSSFSFSNDSSMNLTVPFISCLTADLMETDMLRSVHYWATQMLSPVQFEQCVIQAWRTYNCHLFIEIGPDSTFTSLATGCIPQELAESVHFLSSFHEKSMLDLPTNIHRVRRLIQGKILGGRFSKLYKPISMPWRVSHFIHSHPSFPKLSRENSQMQQFNVASVVQMALKHLIGKDKLHEINNFTPFVAMGIDSLGSIAMRNFIAQNLNLENLPQALIFQYQNISELSDYISELLESKGTEEKSTTESLSTSEDQLSNVFDASAIQQSMIFHHLSEPSQASFIETFLWEINGNFSVAKFVSTIQFCIRYFPGLRTVFDPFKVPVAAQQILTVEECSSIISNSEWLTILDWSGKKDLSAEQFDSEFNSVILSSRQSLHDLTSLPLFSFLYVIPPLHLGKPPNLIFTIHHLITDGVSMSLLLKKIEDFSRSVPSSIDESSSYQLVLQREKKLIAEDSLMKSYWNKVLKENSRFIKQQTKPWIIDFSDNEVVREYLTISDFSTLNSIARQAGVTLSCFFHAIFGIYYTEVSNSESVCYGTTIYGRSGNKAIENVFGPALNTIPFFHKISEECSFTNYLKIVQGQLFETLENGSLPLSEILKISTEVTHTSNKLFNLIFDYQQNRWDFSYQEQQEITHLKFLKLLDRIGCPLSVRVLVNDNEQQITLIATSESSEFTSEFLQTVLQGFQEMILSVLLLWKDNNTLDNSIRQLKREFASSFQVKQQKFSSVFPTIKGKFWSLPYVDFSMVCSKKAISHDSLISTIFAMYCLALAKYCNAEFLGVLFTKDKDDIRMIPFSLHYSEALNELVERVDDLAARNITGGNKDSPIFISREDFILKEKYPVALRVLKADEEGVQVRLHWNLDEAPLEVRNLVVQSMQLYFLRWCSNKNYIYRHSVLSLKRDVSNIHPYVPDIPFADNYMHDALLKECGKTFSVVGYGEDGSKEVLSFDSLRHSSYLIAKSIINSVSFQEIPKNVEERIRLTSLDTDELSQSCNGVVAVVMEKGWEQVVACLAILRIGHAYLPMDAKSWSEHRIRQVLEISEAVAVVTQPRYLESEGGSWLQNISIPVISVDKSMLTQREGEINSIVSFNPRFQPISTDQLAYLIYTSGSTGLPKGVCCHHKGAMNTIHDLNDHFEVTSADKILGLSSLSFDLSVYDIFGMLACGGCLVLPSAQTVSPPDPAEWYNIVVSEGITIWNTVPAFMELIVSHLEIIGGRLPECLRLIYMSGDWIPINLPTRIRAVSDCKNLRIISMGGATEASIWSNIFEISSEGLGIPDGWTSVPYGQPMRNQEMYILNEKLEPCELWVTGGIFIGGVGVAHGYYKNEDRTKYHFITHPKTGEKLFRTGDLGRVRPGGLLEILGREDNQVKVNGFRIELGEIEKTLLQHDKVQNSVVTVQNNALCAYIVLRDTADSDSETNSDHSDFHDFYDELKSICQENLTEYMIPQHLMVIDKIPLSPNGKIARDQLPKVSTTKTTRVSETFTWNEKESILLNVWASVLNVEENTLTPTTNFFSVGGDSLRSIQVVAQSKSLGMIVSISNIFKYPTIRDLAAHSLLLKELGPETLGVHSEEISTKPIFEIEDRNSTPYEEYPLIGTSTAHFVGLHTSSFAAEGMTPQIYFEWEFSEKTLGKQSSMKQLNVPLFEQAIDLFVARHTTFRSYVTPHGTMKPLEFMPHYSIAHVHEWNGNEAAATTVLLKNREEMTTKSTNVHEWPLFEFRVTHNSSSSTIIHIAVSLFLMDAMSDLIFRQELSALYRGLHLNEPPDLPALPRISFKDYCISFANQLPHSQEYLRAKKYWLERLPTLKSGPELPLLATKNSSQERSGNFVNRHIWLTAAEYSRAKKNCAYHSVTLPTVLLTVYAIALSRFASSNEFLINVLLCLRHQVHEDVNKLVGNCSSTVLCNIDLRDEADGSSVKFLSAIQRIAKELSNNLEYSVMTAVEVMQELNRRRGNTFQAVAPFIFTTPIGVEQGNKQVSSRNWMFQELFFSERVPHTACVNAIKADPNGTACASMDFVDGQFPEEVLDGLFDVYSKFIKLLCSPNPTDWNSEIKKFFQTPVGAKRYSDVPLAISNDFMHDGLLKRNSSTNAAVVTRYHEERTEISYALLDSSSLTLSHLLAKQILQSDEKKKSLVFPDVNGESKEPKCNGVIAVVMEKGWEQVVACLAILRIGHAYLPMDAKSWSEHRIRQVLEISEAVAVVTQPRYLESEGGSWLQNISIPVISVDKSMLTQREGEINSIVSFNPRFQPISTDQLAYLIYTSGSTGLPKGVCCHHKGAMNTIHDLNDHFEVTSADKILGLSSLSFDLSVYDIFGMLACGGCLVLPSAQTVSPPDPAEWYNIVVSEGITIWNTVPAFMELIVSHLEIIGGRLPECLRLIYMSGDWIPINLPTRIRAVSDCKNLRIISMGGATEASIWSNIFEISSEGLGIPDGWTSVPYGQPMRNQEMYILNEKLEPCELWVTGGIFIGGVGVAHGYYKNEDRTKYHFITHPKTGEKLFRTGDLGRVRPGGLLEILGREDNQVKVNGFRIELGEIEKTLLQHDKVQNSVVSVQNNSLCAYIVMKDNDPNSKLYDSLYRKLRELCKKQLTEYMIPQHFMIIQEIPLSSNGKIARDRLPKLQSIVNASSGGATSSDQSIIEPMNDLEKQIRHLFSMILNIPETTICCESQTFFTLGGNSLSSIQLLFAIRKHLEKTMTVQDLFQHSTVRKIYEFLYPQQQQQLNQVDSMENNQSQSKKLFQYVLSEGKKNHPVIILFNPAGATGLCYLRYAKLLGDSFPIFAIDDGCIQNGLDFEFESIQEVASTAIPLIEDITKRFRNPSESTGKVKVILAGWSYGGVVAIEVAKLILQRSNLSKDIDVQCLSLFDSPVTAPIFSSPSGSQNDDFPVELLSSTNNSNNSNSNSNSTSSMDSLIQQMTRTHFDKCTALLELYYRSPVDPAEFSCPIHDIRAEKSNYFIPFESITNLVMPSALSSVERSVIPGGDHWNIITGDYVQQTAQESVQFWKKYLLSK